jgi:hypothetical protein
MLLLLSSVLLVVAAFTLALVRGASAVSQADAEPTIRVEGCQV